MTHDATTVSARAPFWADTFDGDLLKLVPGVEAALGDAARIPLWTHCAHPTQGRINLPNVWNQDAGLCAFFALDANTPGQPAYCITSGPRLECTWLEVLRDVWSHNFGVVAGGTLVLEPDGFAHELALLYDVRGWTLLDATTRATYQQRSLDTVRAATQALQRRKNS